MFLGRSPSWVHWHMMRSCQALRSLLIGHTPGRSAPSSSSSSSLPLQTPRLRLARGGRERASEFIGWDATADKWTALVGSVIEGEGRAMAHDEL